MKNPGADVRIELYEPGAADFARMAHGLDSYTDSVGGPAFERRFFAFRALRDDDMAGQVVAGEVAGALLWGQADIKMLVVYDGMRGQGVGGALLDAVARHVRAGGAKGITLWTASWQGEGFYERHGYRAVMRLPVVAPGFSSPQYKIYYHRDLTADDGA